MIQSEYLSVFATTTRDELLRDVVRFSKRLGFDTVSATAVIDHVGGEPEFISVDNTPAAYRDDFLDHKNAKRDPVSQHCKNSSVPIVWSQATYVAADAVELWERQACYGYCHGVSSALHMPNGRHFCLGLDRDQPLPEDAVEMTRLVADIQLFAVYAQDAAMRVLLPASSTALEVPTLTPRELEALRWTMEGKTAWEIGRILGIAEQTAVRHTFNASRKLGCVGKHQAVLKALRLKLIW